MKYFITYNVYIYVTSSCIFLSWDLQLVCSRMYKVVWIVNILRLQTKNIYIFTIPVVSLWLSEHFNGILHYTSDLSRLRREIFEIPRFPLLYICMLHTFGLSDSTKIRNNNNNVLTFTTQTQFFIIFIFAF